MDEECVVFKYNIVSGKYDITGPSNFLKDELFMLGLLAKLTRAIERQLDAESNRIQIPDMPMPGMKA